MEENIHEAKIFATFDKFDEFLSLQRTFLAIDLYSEPQPEHDTNEKSLLRKLTIILDEYQEQSYLLDPFLDQLVVPAIECFKAYAKATVSRQRDDASVPRIHRLGLLLYGYIKCRGYKTIIRYFPHEITDMSIALEYILISGDGNQDSSQGTQLPLLWTLRYLALLWLSLVCMIPFDLVQFDEEGSAGQTATTIDSVAKNFLGKAGLERDAACVLLSRLYIRKDTRANFPAFLEWSLSKFVDENDVFISIGILQTICEVIKSGPSDQVGQNISILHSIANKIVKESNFWGNGLIRKLKVKLLSRIALRILPTSTGTTRQRARILGKPNEFVDTVPSNDVDVPEDVETVLDQLFSFIQDRDTIVRWSAAKGVARLAERLPPDYCDQVTETIIGLFSIHSVAAANLYDLPAIAESTWHGACLACAEMARRGLVTPGTLPKLIDWLSKALYFDLRKGAHSIGSNVRDAAAYVLWALARSQNSESLSPHAVHLAQRLVVATVYDREIHIRRAASAAYQEFVGRTSLFPDGISILRETDFYTVSGQRNAFLHAAPRVARFDAYRESLFNHLLDVTLRHWDVTMRQLGSQSLQQVCLIDPLALGPKAEVKLARLIESVDNSDLHGCLLALSELSNAYRAVLTGDELQTKLQQLFQYLSRVPYTTLTGPRNGLVTSAACILISNTITLPEIQNSQKSSVPSWRNIMDHGLKHRSPVVQDAAASALGSNTLIRELETGSFVTQQSLGRFLGAVSYDAHPNSLQVALQCLLRCTNPAISRMKSNIEARRNCYVAISQILVTIAPSLPSLYRVLQAEVSTQLFEALLNGLTDYTSDERGDVGSWIRMACIRGLTDFAITVLSHANEIPNVTAYLPPPMYHRAVAGILKQGVERLDNVRQEAGVCFLRLLRFPLHSVVDGEQWNIKGNDLISNLFLSEQELKSWSDGSWLFPKAVRFLEIRDYRDTVLPGLVLSVGSKTDSTHRPIAASLVHYCKTIPVQADDHASYDLHTFVTDLISYGKSSWSSNAVAIPVLQTFNILLEGDVFERVIQSSDTLNSLRQLLAMTTNNVSGIKNVQRTRECMKVVINLLLFSHLFRQAASSLNAFLTHRFPHVRSDTAEYLYIFFQSKDIGKSTDAVEEILLETEWSSSDLESVKQASQQVVESLLGQD